MKIAVYPGTFDPLTHGHVDLIMRAAKLFDKLIVAIAKDANKTPFFSIDKRVCLASQVLNDLSNVKVISFSGLLVDFVKANNAAVIIRGLRAVSDFEYELQLALANRSLNSEIETMFLAPSKEFSFVSSSLVKEIASLGGDVSGFVDPLVKKALNTKIID